MKISVLEFICMVVLIGTVVTGYNGYNVGYQSGQVDSLIGKQNLHLLTNTVSTATWEYNK